MPSPCVTRAALNITDSVSVCLRLPWFSSLWGPGGGGGAPEDERGGTNGSHDDESQPANERRVMVLRLHLRAAIGLDLQSGF